MTQIIQIGKVEETRLWRALSESSDADANAIAHNVVSLCQEATDRMKAMYAYAPQYTLHDDRHLLRVTELMAYVLGSELEKLNTVELALLILSAFFHDQGMVPLEPEIASLEQNEKFLLFKDNWRIEHPNYRETFSQMSSPHVDEERLKTLATRLAELDSAMLTDFLRDTHGGRSVNVVRSSYKGDKRLEVQGVDLSSMLGNLCLSHTLPCGDLTPANGFRYDEQVGRFTVNLPFLAAVLRIADILDFDRDRTPEVLLKNIHFTSDVSIREWEKHRSVEGWSISDKLIRFTIRCSHPAYESAARMYMDWIDAELTACLAICQNQPRDIKAYQLRLPSKVDRSRIGSLDSAYRAHDLEFSLSRNEIVRLLMTDKLYGREHLCIRELLQNSLDALRYRKALFREGGTEWDGGRVDFRHYVDSNGFEVLQCVDNGAGMDENIIRNHFVRIGRSYYRSPIFDQERNRLKQSGSDFDPCSKFGIGFMSCFMLGDRITIMTRKDYGQGRKWGLPLVIEIHGLSGLLVVRQGSEKQPVGTTVTIVCRQKPSFLDSWTDKIQLCSVLKGYALAPEFPISGKCEVEEIVDTVEIPPCFEKAQTLMESTGLSSCITLEQDISAVSRNLGGYVRESFLVDDTGLPCLSNHDTEWRPKSQGSMKGWYLTLLPEDRQLDYDFMGWCVPVCTDGILVAGMPGRPSYQKEVRMRLGSRNSNIHSKSPALIDARGDMKPELTPARIPPEFFGTNMPPGWQRLDDAFKQGLGLLWKQLADYLQRGLAGEQFWKLCVVHNISVSWIPQGTLWDCLPVSLRQKEGGTLWRLVRELGELSFDEDDDSSFVLRDSDGNSIGPDAALSEWERAGKDHPSLRWQMNSIALLMCGLDIRNGQVVLVPRAPKAGTELLARYASSSILGVNMFYVDYTGDAGDAVAVQTPYPTANRNHALSVMALKSRYTSQPTDLERFAQSFMPCISETVSTRKQTPSLDNPNYWQKRVGYLFFDVQWNQYDSALRPPYKIWTSKDGWTNIDEKDFVKWRDVPAIVD
ncbi:MAG: ATP-binding protein [Lentisphaeria bacterium]|nr:ATP-binding protein [Lentisphaeria bacterium]